MNISTIAAICPETKRPDGPNVILPTEVPTTRVGKTSPPFPKCLKHEWSLYTDGGQFMCKCASCGAVILGERLG
jgi:hypothetical protein